MKDLLIGLALLSGPAVIFAVFGTPGLAVFDDSEAANVNAAAANRGRIAFAENCVACHGRLAQGTAKAPPLTSRPGRRARLSREAFRASVRKGAGPRDRSRGRMPSFPRLSDSDVDGMFAFLTALEQRH